MLEEISMGENNPDAFLDQMKKALIQIISEMKEGKYRIWEQHSLNVQN